ncbi:hypothetical protein BRD15_00920 [Halobacteriales archaeon SW_6_65_15]|jgi:hypothetical protein|nr:MAG: hypothetical protein BRD15_00920 [Halobacteriales archaeon SW_6_65_15]
MSETPQVMDKSAFKEGSLGKQVLFTVVTLGLYTIYWTYKTAKMLDRGTDQSLSPILTFIPFVNIIVYWQISKAGEAVTEQDAMPVFLLFLFFPVISWYWVQSGINSATSQ